MVFSPTSKNLRTLLKNLLRQKFFISDAREELPLQGQLFKPTLSNDFLDADNMLGPKKCDFLLIGTTQQTVFFLLFLLHLICK